MYARPPRRPGSIVRRYLIAHVTHTHTHSRVRARAVLLRRPAPVFSEWCLCVVQACSWAVYIHGESHLGGSQTVCLWPCLPVVTHGVQCSCWQAGGSSESQTSHIKKNKKLHFGAVRWQEFLGHLGVSFEVKIQNSTDFLQALNNKQ